MKNSNKIFITLIILLIIVLSYVTFKYVEMSWYPDTFSKNKK